MATYYRLERFCCCCTLNTGSLVIATLTWILGLWKIIDINFGIITYSKSYNNSEYEKITEEYYNLLFLQIRSRTYFRIGYSFILLITGVMLVYGILKKKLYFFLPWLIVICIVSIVVTILCVVLFVLIFILQDEGAIYALIFCIVVALISGCYWYSWACVYSHYCELKEANELDIGTVNYRVQHSSSAACSENTEQYLTQMA